jgi:hypothetical protein
LNVHEEKGKISTSQNQENFWPKCILQRVTLKITHRQIKIGLSHLSKNPIKENFEENFLMKKKAIVVIKPKLLTTMTETQKLERYNSCKKKG